MDIQLITDIAQGAGGLAGLIALVWQISDARKKRNAIVWPPELRPFLLNMIKVCDAALQRPRDREWGKENAHPLYKEASHLKELLHPEKCRLDRVHLNLIAACMAAIETYGRDRLIESTPEVAARYSLKQQEMAEEGRTAALAILRRLDNA